MGQVIYDKKNDNLIESYNSFQPLEQKQTKINTSLNIINFPADERVEASHSVGD